MPHILQKGLIFLGDQVSNQSKMLWMWRLSYWWLFFPEDDTKETFGIFAANLPLFFCPEQGKTWKGCVFMCTCIYVHNIIIICMYTCMLFIIIFVCTILCITMCHVFKVYNKELLKRLKTKGNLGKSNNK